ncbi:hypothetical protein HC928_19755 [bacterium]|nr:hypothetical protein [bacterium]
MPAHFTVEALPVSVYDSNEALGQAAAQEFAAHMTQAIDERGEAAVILATGNSQLSFIQAVHTHTDIAWDRVTVFHMDEYIGLPADHPASFRRWMRERVLEAFQPKALHTIEGDAPDIPAELARYAACWKRRSPS